MLDHLVNFPTNVKDNSLDLELTNILERVMEVTEVRRTGKSDYVVTTGGGNSMRKIQRMLGETSQTVNGLVRKHVPVRRRRNHNRLMRLIRDIKK
jgi:hypothetical protein